MRLTAGARPAIVAAIACAAFFLGIFCRGTVCRGAAAAGGEAPILARIAVDAGPEARRDTPVSASLEGLAVPLDGGLRLEEVRGSERVPVPCQFSGSESPRLWWILAGATEPDETRVFELARAGARPAENAAPAAGGVRVVRDARAVTVLDGGGEALAYNHALVQPPEGADARYTRSGFIHPVWSPAGAELTRIHPPDHIHHVGFWNPYAHTLFEGRHVDFWNLSKGEGTVRFSRFLEVIEGPVFGGFRALHDHIDLTAPGGAKNTLNEEWIVRVWNIGEAGRRLWDFTSVLTCASSSPVTLLKYRYGGMGFRAGEAWNAGDYLTSEGRRRKDGQGTRARWCQVFGPTDQGPAGILFMSHPQNHEHPEPMRIWSDRPEIFFSFCPVQEADWVIEPGKTYVLRYRACVYDGELTPEESERLWRDFGRPPRTSVCLSP